MKTENKLKILKEMDLWEKEMKKYCSPDDRLARFFMQDPENPNIFNMMGSDIKVNREELAKYQKYSRIFVLRPASNERKRETESPGGN